MCFVPKGFCLSLFNICEWHKCLFYLPSPNRLLFVGSIKTEIWNQNELSKCSFVWHTSHTLYVHYSHLNANSASEKKLCGSTWKKARNTKCFLLFFECSRTNYAFFFAHWAIVIGYYLMWIIKLWNCHIVTYIRVFPGHWSKQNRGVSWTKLNNFCSTTFEYSTYYWVRLGSVY